MERSRGVKEEVEEWRKKWKSGGKVEEDKKEVEEGKRLMEWSGGKRWRNGGNW